MSFSESLYAFVVKRFVGGASELNLVCTICGDIGQRGPLQYCMHRDKHLPAAPTFIGCQVGRDCWRHLRIEIDIKPNINSVKERN